MPYFEALKSKMAFILKGYFRLLNKWPTAVQASQAGALMGAGDIIAQTLVEKKAVKEINWKRALQFGAVGFFVVGPPLHIWYGVLDKIIRPSGRWFAVKKMAVDQLTFAPIFIVVVMGSIGLMQGQPLDVVQSRVSHNYKDVLLANYKLWPIVQLCNFYLVPLQYQVLSVQTVALLWNTYLSWKTNTKLGEDEAVIR